MQNLCCINFPLFFIRYVLYATILNSSILYVYFSCKQKIKINVPNISVKCLRFIKIVERQYFGIIYFFYIELTFRYI